MRHLLLRHRGTEDVFEDSLAALLVETTRARRRVQREPIERDAARPLEHHGAMRERQRAATPLGTRRRYLVIRSRVRSSTAATSRVDRCASVWSSSPPCPPSLSALSSKHRRGTWTPHSVLARRRRRALGRTRAPESRRRAPRARRRSAGQTPAARSRWPRGPGDFVDGYNHEHRHGSLGLCTPYEVHHGLADATLARRRGTVLDAAFLAHPERFTRGRPVPASLRTEVWHNKPNPELAEEDAAQ